MIGKPCAICKETITESGRYHHSVCSSACAKVRKEENRKATARKRNREYKLKNPDYGTRKRISDAFDIWELEDNCNGKKWTRLFRQEDR